MAYFPPKPSIISTVNSTTVALAANGVFTGTLEDVTQYASITVSLIASQASATDGLQIQQSPDGTNWDVSDTYTIPAATGKTFGAQIVARYFRIVYTNGATIQASFRLQTIFHEKQLVTSVIKPQDGRSNENDFQEVMAYLGFFNGTSWDRVRGDITNGLDVDVTRLPTITKGTQGTTGVTTQDLKDSGRVLKTYATVGDTGITGVVAPTLVTMTPYANLVAGTAATTFAVTAGKTLRLQQLTVTWRNNTAAAGGVTIRFRMLAGAVLVGSPIHMTLNANSAASIAIGGGGSNSYQFPDGFELSGTMQFGITQQAIGIVAGFSVEVVGYEY